MKEKDKQKEKQKESDDTSAKRQEDLLNGTIPQIEEAFNKVVYPEG